ncbi:MAG: hypothetical protein IT448_11340 [Phycisphaerales bacterium]|nr:hypothetical protein [Phycisphaerales bacterium]
MKPNTSTQKVRVTRRDESCELVPAKKPLLKTLGKVSTKALTDAAVYDPKPIDKPKVSENFDRWSTGMRIAETIRYCALSLEYSLSPSGQLRALTRLTARLTLATIIPTSGFLLVMLVVVALGVPLAAGLAAILVSLETAALALLMTIIYLTLFVVLGAILIGISRLLRHRK